MYHDNNCIDDDAEDNFVPADEESLEEISPSMIPTDFTQVHGQLHVSSIDIRWMGKAGHFGVEGLTCRSCSRWCSSYWIVIVIKLLLSI